MIELFRKEVLERQGTRLQGDIFLALPLRWQALGYLLFASLVAASVFLFTTSYTQYENVSGVVAPEKGVAPVVPTRPGLLVELLVQEGSRVTRGMPLARVRVAEVTTSGQGTAEQLETAIAGQERSIRGEAEALAVVNEREAAGLAEQVRGLEGELQSLRTQIEVQRQLLASARQSLESVRTAADSGFISRRDLSAREEALLMRQQQLAQLQQSHASKSAALAEARRAGERLSARANADRAGAQVRLRAFERQRLDASVAAGYLITAPVDGVATAITARAGQSVGPSSAIMSIVPARAALRAELLVPASVIGYLREGQEVLLSVDGFPPEQFGSLSGKVLSVPVATTVRTDAHGDAVALYPVTCEIERPWFELARRRVTLVAGMTLIARIAMRRQSLGSWLLSPLGTLTQRQ